MKYITFEKSEYHHNLFKDVPHKSLVSYWIYDVYQIDCEINELPEDIQNVLSELPEHAARAAWFSHINLDERKTINLKVEQQVFEWVKDSLNIPSNKKLNARDKFTYNITEEDEKNSVQFIKTILLNYLQRHYDSLSDGNKTRYSKKIEGIKTVIEECKTNHDCHVIMHNHFNYPLLVVKDKVGTSLPGARWNLSTPSKKTEVSYFTPEMLDVGPTIDNISPEVFELKWEIGEPVLVNIE
jgi:hypothetical protein